MLHTKAQDWQVSSPHAPLFERLVEIHSNPPIVLLGAYCITDQYCITERVHYAQDSAHR